MRAKRTQAPGGWLDGLSKRLVWYFPALQVRDILADFREQWEADQERGRSQGEMLAALGTPAEQFPPGRRASPLPGFLLPFGVMALYEAVEQILIAAPLLCLLPYAVGAVLAAVLWAVLGRSGKE